jgi:hypothetical protein
VEETVGGAVGSSVLLGELGLVSLVSLVKSSDVRGDRERTVDDRLQDSKGVEVCKRVQDRGRGSKIRAHVFAAKEGKAGLA